MAENNVTEPDVQRGVQRDTANVGIVPAGLVVCRKCGQVNTRGEDRCLRCKSYVKGSAVQLVHGLRRRPGLELPEEVREAIAEKRQAIAADLGGEAALSQLQRDVLDRYLDLDGLASFQAAELARHGMTTSKGRARALFSAFLQTTDRQVRLAQLLGLERRERAVPSLSDYLDELNVREEQGTTRTCATGEAVEDAPDREMVHAAEPLTEAAGGPSEEESAS